MKFPSTKVFPWLGIRILAVALLSVGGAIWFRPEWSDFSREVELREPGVRPGFPHEFTSAQEWPRNFDAFANDAVPGRQILIETASSLLWKAGVSLSPEVLRGNSDWLFLRNQNSTLERSRGLIRLTPTEEAAWSNKGREIADTVEQSGGRLWWVIIPDKQNVYPELVPHWARPHGPTVTDEIIRILSATGSGSIIDLRSTLKEAAVMHPIYYRTDTHWTGWGAETAARVLLPALLQHQPGQWQTILGNLSVVEDIVRERRGDLARIARVSDIPAEAWIRLKVTDPQITPSSAQDLRFKEWSRHGYRSTSPSGHPGKLLILGDSFFHAELYKPFQESFSEMVFTHHNGVAVSRKLLRTEKPTWMVVIIVERMLPLSGPIWVD